MLRDYDLIRLLGRGSAGSVYLGRHHETDELVAIKHLHTDEKDRVARLRFEREARIMRSLRHRSLVAVRDVVELDDERFLVMEYVDGATLADALPHVGAALAVSLVEQLASALDYVHGAGVLHRDVKPANVLCSLRGECKLSDFGVARFVGDSMHADSRRGFRTRTGTVLGSPAYMAPEVAAGLKDVDARADVYSLAVVAYRCVVGQLPFTGDAYRVLEAQISDAPPAPSDIDPRLGHEVDEVLLRGLAKKPSDRYPTAGSFAAALATAPPRTTDIGLPAMHDALATIVQSISSPSADDGTDDRDRDLEQSATVDHVPSIVSITALPRLPKADTAIFRPPGRHRAKIIVLLVAVAIGGTIGLIVGLVHR